MATFQKGHKLPDLAPAKISQDDVDAHVKSLRPRSDLELDRYELKELPQEDLMNRLCESYDKVYELINPGYAEWSADYEQFLTVREMNRAINVVTWAYTALEDVNRKEVSELCGWTHQPLPVGRITYLEWIVFVVSQVFHEANKYTANR